MKTKKVEVSLPASIYNELQQVAEASAWSFEKVLMQTIKNGLPPSLSKVPSDFHEELIALNRLDDMELLRVSEGKGSRSGKQDEIHKKADFATLRRTYALSVLKWRGHPVPTPYDALLG
jgi:hypothetical protein